MPLRCAHPSCHDVIVPGIGHSPCYLPTVLLVRSRVTSSSHPQQTNGRGHSRQASYGRAESSSGDSACLANTGPKFNPQPPPKKRFLQTPWGTSLEDASKSVSMTVTPSIFITVCRSRVAESQSVFIPSLTESSCQPALHNGCAISASAHRGGGAGISVSSVGVPEAAG